MDSETEELIPIDSFVSERAYNACKTAVQGTGSIPSNIDVKTLQFMRQRELVHTTDSGELVLARDAICHGTMVSGAVLERSFRSKPTTLELQYDLVANGWEFSDNLRMGSVHNKTGINGNPPTYYALLTYFPDSLESYEDEDMFHHKQGEQYYKTVEIALTVHSEEIIDIPPYMTAKQYLQLQKFLVDGSVQDPREEENQRKKQKRQVGFPQNLFPLQFLSF